MTESEAKGFIQGFIQGKLDCMEKCNVFNREHSYNTDLCDNCEYCYSQGTLGEQKESFQMAINEPDIVNYHEQIGNWLEELSKRRVEELFRKRDEKVIRDKAIDDFVEKIELKYLGVHPDDLYERYYPIEICKQVKELAEQLKEKR